MHWVAPAEKDSVSESIEKRLWASPDHVRVNSGLKAQEYAGPSDEDFKEQLETLNEELESLNAQSRELEAAMAKNVAEILEV
jgi:hypothetical protein